MKGGLKVGRNRRKRKQSEDSGDNPVMDNEALGSQMVKEVHREGRVHVTQTRYTCW